MSAQWEQTLEELKCIPQKPRKVTGAKNWYNGLQLFVDYLATVPPRMAKATAPLRRYGRDFEKIRFDARDGVSLAAWLGKAPSALAATSAGTPSARRDGVLLIPGLYTSKDNARIRARCERILRQYGMHVLALDLRGVGESQRVPSTPGWKEALDIVDAIAEFRRRVDVKRIHVYTESLAASAALVAAGIEGREGRRLTNGAVLSMSPFTSARDIVELYSTREPENTPMGKDFVMVQRFFNALLRLQGFRGGRFDAFVDYGAEYYGTTPQALVEASDPLAVARYVNVPTLVVHSTDDGLVPVSHARTLRDSVKDHPWLHVWELPWGYHCLYEMADPAWYWRVLETLWLDPTVGVHDDAATQSHPPGVL